MSIHDFNVTQNNGQEISLKEYAGKVLLIVNTASKCGFTPQYTELEELFQKYHSQGLEILAFPCNQFGGQEPGSDAEIAEFCSLNFKTTFPLFQKVDVNGENAHPLFDHLKEAAKGVLGTKAIKWNFTKFLVSRDGQTIKRYASMDKPIELASEIEKLLQN
jgi:glutathione peroxidase